MQKLRFEGRRCTGVEFARGGRGDIALSAIETILAAGSIGSPQILQLSGVGPAALLSEHGISVVHDLPGVGENLQDHLQLRMGFKVKNVVTLNQRVHSIVGKASMALEYALFRTGPLTMAPSQLGGFTRSAPEHTTPNIEFHVQPLTLDKFGEPLHKFAAFTASVCNLRPTSRGHVRIRNRDPHAPPAINCRYLTTPRIARWPPTHCSHAASPRSQRCEVSAGRIHAGRRVSDRRPTRACGGQRRHDDLSSGGYMQDGGNR